MFWGLIMQPGKKYSQTVEKPFHISHAALDLDTANSNDPVQILLSFEGRNYLICTLQKGKYIQQSLDLNFQGGDAISFATNGPGHVHLTGYLVEDDMFEMEEGEEEEDEETEDNHIEAGKKRKATEDRKEKNSSKKSKTELLLDELAEDEDDSDVNLEDLLEGSSELEGEEEEDDDEDDDEDEDDDDDENNDEDAEDSDDEDEADEEEIEVPQLQQKKKGKGQPKENGVQKQQASNKQSPKQQTPKQQQSPKQNQTPKQNQNQQKKEKTPKQNQNQQQQKQKSPGKENATPQKKTLEGGVIIEDLKPGNGEIAKPGRFLQVHYEGRFKNNNKVFDSTKTGPGFKFRLGKEEVLKGWDIGLCGMKVGGKRRITCPPNMAYGAQGSPPVIPSNSTLVFDVELKNVK